MDKKDVLKELGLSDGESLVYLTLLRLGEVQVNKIKTETKIHRTTIYDFLDKLIKKGLVSYVVKNNVKFYRAAHPSRLEELIKEKKEHLEEIIPSLIKLTCLEKKHLKVEIYEGVEGFKTLTNRILRIGDDLLSFGIDESKFEEKFPHVIKTYIKKEQKAGMQEWLISQKGTKFVYKHSHIHYRYTDKKFFSPTPTMIFGENVGFLIWEPLTVILIENKDLADAYRRHFKLLWKTADKTP
ncbi:MAG: helix-turn-helix domain-containing protein [Candidatus Aenigmarchaeota archaeon]|nr:helix-turn-helix domain-containing protein [Candidatus Aenigmarchaeota archaeon]MDI6722573.1 helix-turn-helix domain-containing protein [Candidatus Aenigmarchaeota archaeon]